MQRPLPQPLAEVFKRWRPAVEEEAVPLLEAVFSGGHSNRNFLVRYGRQRLVVRLPDADGIRFGVDREAERRALELADRLGLGAPVLYCDPPTGTLITSYLDSRPLRIKGMGADHAIDRLAAALRLLHSQAVDLPRVDVAERVRGYAREIQAGGDPRHWARARGWIEASRRVLEQYRFSRWKDGLCHHDLVAQNILDVGGQIRFIDWEYAGRGDPFFDLATVAEEHGFEVLDRQRLLLAYGEFGAEALERLYRARILHRLLGALWYLLRLRRVRTPDAVSAALLRHEQALNKLLEEGPGE